SVTSYTGIGFGKGRVSFFTEGVFIYNRYNSIPVEDETDSDNDKDKDKDNDNNDNEKKNNETQDTEESPSKMGMGGHIGLGYKLSDRLELEIGFSLFHYNLIDETTQWETEATLPRISYEIRRVTLFGELMFFNEGENFAVPSNIGAKVGFELEL
ncbi:MAG: hypothetical protein HQK54_13775, partial [Oligoflexales bacterium]|nr:hypothetical protein [Oligoflexales bacterium]